MNIDFCELLSFKKDIVLTSLQELDFLTELFLFFDDFDITINRQTSKWWNDLLLKDTQTIFQIKKNSRHVHYDSYTNCWYTPYPPYKISSQFGYLSILIWYDKVKYSSGYQKPNIALPKFNNICRRLIDYFYPRNKNGTKYVYKPCGCIVKVREIIGKKEEICSYSAMEGHLKVLKWARENDYFWTENTCGCAIMCNRPKFLRWSIRNGCPLDEDCFDDAIRHNDVEAFKLLLENGCPLHKHICSRSTPEIRAYIHGLSQEKRVCDCIV